MSAPDVPKPGSLAVCFQEVFTAAARLRFQRQSPRDVAVFRQHCRDALLSGAEDAQQIGYRSEDVRSSMFAVAAYLDEAALHAADARFAEWLGNPVERELFQTREAAEAFYRKLRDALARPQGHAATDLIEVFQHALLLGFLGMYGPATAERKKLIETCAERIRSARGASREFSPSWRAPSPLKPRPAVEWIPPAPEPPAAAVPIDDLVRQAEARLAFSGSGSGLRSSACILVLGETGSIKTSSILHSGVDRRELAGEIHRNGNVTATELANFWLANRVVVVEAGGTLLPDRERWHRLLEHLRPMRAPRAALVCFDSERLTRPKSAELAARGARYMGEHLNEYALAMGCGIPVYVLFTRMDRVAGYAEFVRKLSHDEAAWPVGATLSQFAGGADSTAALATRVKTAYDGIYRSLAVARTELMARDSDTVRASMIYEFPREFQKLKGPVATFLSEICPPERPGAFLRGFYFSGARPIVIEEGMPVPAASGAAPPDSGATGMFGGAAEAAAQPKPAPPVAHARKKIPQWLFLPQLFHEVLLRDFIEV